jgi:co-chaperonin GroES (HSP10)
MELIHIPVKPSKNRVALIESPIAEEASKGIVLPQTRHRLFAMGQVMALGPEAETAGVKLFQSVVFQVNPSFEKTIRFQVGEHQVLLMHAGDLIGELTSTRFDMDTFSPLGRWVIVEHDYATMVGDLYLPENNLRMDTRRSYYLKHGPQSEVDLAVGQEVFCDPNRVTPIQFSSTKGHYGFVDPGFIYGSGLVREVKPEQQAPVTTSP